MNRTQEREWVIKLAYQSQLNKIEKDYLDNILDYHKVNTEFIRSSLLAIFDNVDEIDQIIEDHMSNSNMNTLLAIESAILRVAVNEFVISKTVPTSVAINEAVENAKKYGNQDSYKLINGILSSIAKDI
ncbi:transcription antitermination factor NusB [Helcococcus massiliensis]|uniref:transcription antitermination factor NusB n=1 Tax=Helcococcus massiliensis TaxID=2040290 RepID=UPI000CDE76EA|nr:transcription antitermination factor NusB [Helcococcus massiliensis]